MWFAPHVVENQQYQNPVLILFADPDLLPVLSPCFLVWFAP